MKLILGAFCATVLASPLAFASDCSDKEKCDKKKDESTLVENCEKDCDTKKCDKKKDEGTIAGNCEKCKDGEKKEKKQEGTLV